MNLEGVFRIVYESARDLAQEVEVVGGLEQTGSPGGVSHCLAVYLISDVVAIVVNEPVRIDIGVVSNACANCGLGIRLDLGIQGVAQSTDFIANWFCNVAIAVPVGGV